MLTHVRVKNLLTAEKSVTVLHLASGAATSLRLPAGVLRIASQDTALGREASVGVHNGMEVLFTNSQPHPRVSVLRHHALGASALQHVDVRPHLFDVSTVDAAYAVKGLPDLALHLMRRQHCFDGLARRPLPLGDLSPAASVQRIQEMRLAFPANADAAALSGLGAVCRQQAGPANSTVAAGVAKYTAFFMFNANMISRLTALFPAHDLGHARGVCLNMALATHMSADSNTVVQAETLTQAPVPPALYTALQALRAGRPCAAVVCRGAQGKYRRSVYDAQELGLGFAMFSKAGAPVVVGLAGGVERWRPCMPSNSVPHAGGVDGDWRHDKAQRPPPRPTPPVSTHALSAGAATDMLVAHAASAEGALAPLRYALKNACYAKHAARLGADERAVLLALSRENSPGVFAMAAELVFVDAAEGAAPRGRHV